MTIRFTITTETGETCDVAYKARGVLLRDDCGDVYGPFENMAEALPIAASCLYVSEQEARDLWFFSMPEQTANAVQ